jgi:hypothetical protein
MASRTYRVVVTGIAFLSRQHVPMHIGNHRLSIRNRNLGIRDHRVSVRDRHSGIRDHRLGVRNPDVRVDG